MEQEIPKPINVSIGFFLVLRNVCFPTEEWPTEGYPLMSFVCYWIQKNLKPEDLDLRPWFDIKNASYLYPVRKARRGRERSKRLSSTPYRKRPLAPPILIEFFSQEQALNTLRKFVAGDVGGSEILERFSASPISKSKNLSLRRCLLTFRSLGHHVCMHPSKEDVLLVDNIHEIKYNEETGKLNMYNVEICSEEAEQVVDIQEV